MKWTKDIDGGELPIQDRVKALYQRYFGGGHMVADAGASLSRLRAECEALSPVPFEEPLFEALGGGMARMNLRPLLKTGVALSTANAMFVYTANHTRGDREGFLRALEALPETEADRAYLAAYAAEGYPAVRHSEAYRQVFQPAYRVVSTLFEKTFALFVRMDGLRRGIVAIDGPCTSGKSTLAAAVSEVYGITLLHMDDFFLRPQQRTPERLAEPGGNVDRERFAQEALEPLARGVPFAYTPYNCAVQHWGEPVEVRPTELSLVEGVYAMHPDLLWAYALRVFMKVGPEEQLRRIERRNGPALLKRFRAEWIPMENAYFEAFDVEKGCDLTFCL